MRKAKIILDKEKNKNFVSETKEINIEISQSSSISDIKSSLKEKLPFENIPFFLFDFENKVIADEKIIGEYFGETIKKGISVPFDIVLYLQYNLEDNSALDFDFPEILVEECDFENDLSDKVINKADEDRKKVQNWKLIKSFDEDIKPTDDKKISSRVNSVEEKNKKLIFHNKQISDAHLNSKLNLNTDLFNRKPNCSKTANEIFEEKTQYFIENSDKSKNQDYSQREKNLNKSQTTKKISAGKVEEIEYNDSIFTNLEANQEYKLLELQINESSENERAERNFIKSHHFKEKRKKKSSIKNSKEFTDGFPQYLSQQSSKLNESISCRKRKKSDCDNQDFYRKHIQARKISISSENSFNKEEKAVREKETIEHKSINNSSEDLIDINKIDSIEIQVNSSSFGLKTDEGFRISEVQNSQLETKKQIVDKINLENGFANKIIGSFEDPSEIYAKQYLKNNNINEKKEKLKSSKCIDLTNKILQLYEVIETKEKSKTQELEEGEICEDEKKELTTHNEINQNLDINFIDSMKSKDRNKLHNPSLNESPSQNILNSSIRNNFNYMGIFVSEEENKNVSSDSKTKDQFQTHCPHISHKTESKLSEKLSDLPILINLIPIKDISHSTKNINQSNNTELISKYHLNYSKEPKDNFIKGSNDFIEKEAEEFYIKSNFKLSNYPYFFQTDIFYAQPFDDEILLDGINGINDLMSKISLNNQDKQRQLDLIQKEIPILYPIKEHLDFCYTNKESFKTLFSLPYDIFKRRKEFEYKKINLILDIDSTLIHALNVEENSSPVHLDTYDNSEIFEISIFFNDKGYNLKFKIRKYVIEFLKISENFCNIFICTHGVTE